MTQTALWSRGFSLDKLCVTSCCLKDWWTTNKTTAPLSKVSFSFNWRLINTLHVKTGWHFSTMYPKPSTHGQSSYHGQKKCIQPFSAEDSSSTSLKSPNFRHYTVNQMLRFDILRHFWINQCLEIWSYFMCCTPQINLHELLFWAICTCGKKLYRCINKFCGFSINLVFLI